MYLLPITLTLVFLGLASLALVCILVLQALALDTRIKAGYAFLAFTFMLWAWKLYTLPNGPGTWWLYALPILWLVLLFRYGFPLTQKHEFSLPLADEPRYTQEALGGAPARREALTFYFLLLLIALILGLVFFQMAMRLP